MVAGKKKHFNLLVIEDDPADVDLMREALGPSSDADLSIHLSVIEDPERVKNYLLGKDPVPDAARPDLILLDLNMPRKGGLEVLKELKGDEQLRTIPVVILTTSSAAEDVDRCYQLGANGYVTKAKDFSEFLKIMKTIEEFWFKIATLPKT